MKFEPEHCKSVGESYFRHALFAFSVGIKSILCGVFLLFHSVFPFCQFEKWNLEGLLEIAEKANKNRLEKKV